MAQVNQPDMNVNIEYFVNKEPKNVNFGIVPKFQWAASINKGHVIEFVIEDNNFNNVRGTDLLVDFFKYGKNTPFFIVFKINYDVQMDGARCIIDSIVPYYNQSRISAFKITAIDPVTWFLRCHVPRGLAIHGSTKDYFNFLIKETNTNIKEILGDKYKIKLEMDSENEEKVMWYTLKKSALENIRSSLCYGNSFGSSHSPYIMTVNDCHDEFKLYIRDQQELKTKAGTLHKEVEENLTIMFGTEPPTIGAKTKEGMFEGVFDSWIGFSYPELRTANISSTTGELISDVIKDVGILKPTPKDEDSKKTYFKKSKKKFGAFAVSCAEKGDGTWGNYSKYISSATKQKYSDIAKSSSRMKIILWGKLWLCKPENLGAIVVKVNFTPKIMIDGPWVIYAYEHTYEDRQIETSVYLYRLDSDYNEKYEVKI